jgi:hypothetical protein
MANIRLSKALCVVVGEVLSKTGSHASLNTIFTTAGAPGVAPDSAHHSKWKEWLFRAGIDPDVDSLLVLGNVLEEFMDVSPKQDAEALARWQVDRERVVQVLEESGLRYYRGGRVLRMSCPPTVPVLHSLLENVERIRLLFPWLRALRGSGLRAVGHEIPSRHSRFRVDQHVGLRHGAGWESDGDGADRARLAALRRRRTGASLDRCESGQVLLSIRIDDEPGQRDVNNPDLTGHGNVQVSYFELDCRITRVRGNGRSSEQIVHLRTSKLIEKRVDSWIVGHRRIDEPEESDFDPITVQMQGDRVTDSR